MRLANKVAYISGGGSGIGEAIAHRFAEEGACVVISDINLEAVQRVANEIVAKGNVARALLQDVTNPDTWQPILDDIVAQHGSLDVVVNNAGIGIPGSIEDVTLADWRKTNAVNLEAVFMGTQAAIRCMKECGGGSIINISSIEGIVGDPILAAYNASKAGVRMMTKSSALHCATAGYRIRVNSIHPGFIETPMVDPVTSGLTEEAFNAFIQRVLAEVPMGYFGQPVDVANGALFLASDESSYMTGSELVIDGGFTAH